MYKKAFINLLIVVFLVLFQISFVHNLPSWFMFLDPVLIFIIFYFITHGMRSGLLVAALAGVMFDFISFYPFGFYSISFLLSLIILNFLLEHFFTNNSLYSILASVFFFIIFQEIFFDLMIYFYKLVGVEFYNVDINIIFLKVKLIYLVVNIIIASLIFYFINFFSSSFKLFLLERK